MIKKSIKPVYPSAIEIISQSLQLFRLKFPVFIQVFLIPSIVTTILISIYFLIFHPQFDTPQNTLHWILTPGFALFFVLSLIVNLWSQASLVYAVVHLKEELVIKKIFTTSLQYIPSLFFLNLIVMLTVLGGSIFLIIPGLFCAIIFSLSNIILIAESEPPMVSVLKSYHYISGHLKAYFIRLVTFGLLAFFAMFLANFAVSLISNDFISSIVDFVANLFFTIISLLFTYLNYLYIKSFASKSDKYVPTKRQQIVIKILMATALIVIGFVIYIFFTNRSFFA